MADSDESKPIERKKTPTTIKVGLWLSGIYISIILLHVFCVRGGFTELAGLDLNALGDFFAGVFAPLAFSWLVIAVFVQRDELHAQLQEFQRSVDQAERQTENLERQFALTEKAAQKLEISDKFTLIAAECDSIASLFPNSRNKVSENFKSDNFEEAIKEFTTILQQFNDEQGGLASEWQSLPPEVEDKKDSISHHLRVIISQTEAISNWQKLNEDGEIRAKIVASSLQRLKINSEVIVDHLGD